MNNYIKILTYLRQFAGDTKLHNIHSFLDELELTESKQKVSILSDLQKGNLISCSGGRRSGQIIVGDKVLGKPYEIEFKAKITIEGLKYLKEEIEMEKKGAYIQITGDKNQVVFGSKNVTINNKNEIEDLVKKILDTIESDTTINQETKLLHKEVFYQLEQEVSNNKLNQSTLREAVTIGDSLSSIGSFVLSLLNQLLTSQA